MEQLNMKRKNKCMSIELKMKRKGKKMHIPLMFLVKKNEQSKENSKKERDIKEMPMMEKRKVKESDKKRHKCSNMRYHQNMTFDTNIIRSNKYMVIIIFKPMI
jgi:hypothetical protein